MVADLSSTTTTPKSKLSSPAPAPAPAKPKRVPLKSKNVTSRYMSYTASSKHVTDPNSYSNSVLQTKKTFPSPSPSPKTSTRSLSVSFQGESFALPVSKVGKPENNGLRNGERKKAPAKISERRSRKESFMTMSVDFTNERVKLSGSETAGAVRVLQKSKKTTAITKLGHNKQETLRESDNSDHTDSDPESVSSGSSVGHVRGTGPRAIVVPARFWQETINLLRRVQPVPISVPVSPPWLVKNNKPVSGFKVMHDGPKLPPRGSSFLEKSPTSNGLGNTAASILSICADSKRGKVGEKKLVDAHVLRLLHNKHMQWRFANARMEAVMVVQRAAAQKTLYNAWVTISKLWNSVISKRLQLQQLKHNLKMHSLLKKQMLHLDNWDLTDRDHYISLAGAIGALESSSLCLPVLCGAKVDIQNLKEAICSAVDVMQDMAVAIYSLVTKVENVNSMTSELANAMNTECSLLDQCKDLLSILTFLEKQDCSLRAHILQLIPAATMTQRPKMMPF